MRVTVEILQRQPAKLGLHVAPHAVDGALRDPGHDVALRPGEERRGDVDRHGQQQQAGQLRVVDALARGDVHAGKQLGELVLAACMQSRDDLGLGESGGQRLADETVEDDVGRIADDLRPDDRERDARRAEQGHEDDQRQLGPKPAQQLSQRLAQVPSLTRGRAAHAHEAAAHRPGARPLATAATVDQATAASPSCESTISR